MIKRTLFIAAIVIAVMLFIIIFFSVNNEQSECEEIDIVIDTTHYGKVVFVFVEVEEFDSSMIAKRGKNLRIDYASPDPYEEYIPTSIIAYFYRAKDTLTLTDSLIATLKLDHPKIEQAKRNVCYIKNGFIYRGLSKKTEKKFYIKDTLSRGSFIVPRKGVKANEVFKNI